jgi:hypothetical protein
VVDVEHSSMPRFVHWFSQAVRSCISVKEVMSRSQSLPPPPWITCGCIDHAGEPLPPPGTPPAPQLAILVTPLNVAISGQAVAATTCSCTSVKEVMSLTICACYIGQCLHMPVGQQAARSIKGMYCIYKYQLLVEMSATITMALPTNATPTHTPPPHFVNTCTYWVGHRHCCRQSTHRRRR